jgi:hypothetical protein
METMDDRAGTFDRSLLEATLADAARAAEASAASDDDAGILAPAGPLAAPAERATSPAPPAPLVAASGLPGRPVTPSSIAGGQRAALSSVGTVTSGVGRPAGPGSGAVDPARLRVGGGASPLRSATAAIDLPLSASAGPAPEVSLRRDTDEAATRLLSTNPVSADALGGGHSPAEAAGAASLVSAPVGRPVVPPAPAPTVHALHVATAPASTAPGAAPATDSQPSPARRAELRPWQPSDDDILPAGGHKRRRGLRLR